MSEVSEKSKLAAKHHRNRCLPPREAGTVSHGTLRIQDLTRCFMDYIHKYNYDAWAIIIHDIKLSWETFNQDYAFSEMMCDVMGLDGYRMGLSLVDDDLWWDTDDASTILNEDIWQAMDDIAPPGTSFGAHEGDGSDFGFWPNEDSESNPKEMAHFFIGGEHCFIYLCEGEDGAYYDIYMGKTHINFGNPWFCDGCGVPTIEEIREAVDLMASKSQRLEPKDENE